MNPDPNTVSRQMFLLRTIISTLDEELKKKFLQNSPQRVSKEAEFCTDFKNVLKS
jgi:hypothetical protein